MKGILENKDLFKSITNLVFGVLGLEFSFGFLEMIVLFKVKWFNVVIYLRKVLIINYFRRKF